MENEVNQKVIDALCTALKCEEQDLTEKMRGLFQKPKEQEQEHGMDAD